MINKSLWPPHDVDYLINMYRKVSYGTIAKVLGYSRSAVCGKAWRLGLMKRSKANV